VTPSVSAPGVTHPSDATAMNNGRPQEFLPGGFRDALFQTRFYVKAGGGNYPPPNLSLRPNLWLHQQYAVVKPARRGRFLEVGVVDLVVLACVFNGDD